MAKSEETFAKKEKEKKKLKQRQYKLDKMEERKANAKKAKKEDKGQSEIKRKGIVTFFNEAKGFVFIKDLKTQESVFIHVNQLSEPIKENNKVTFEVEMGPKGLSAINVKKSS